MRETWYRLENGEVANPSDVVADANGKLFKGSIAVAMKGDVPHTVGVDPEAVVKKVEVAPVREVTAERPKRTYATRDGKAV